MGNAHPLLILSSLRYSARHPWQFGLSLLGIALGVAVVVSIDLSSASARRAFDLSTEAVVGRTTHQILGGSTGLEERLYTRLRRAATGASVAPIVEGHLSVSGQPGRTFTLLGVDPFAEGPFRAYAARGGGPDGAGLTSLLSERDTVLISRATAEQLRVAPGDSFKVRVAGRFRNLKVAGLIQAGDRLARESLADLLVADVATAQELLDRVGRLTRIDLIIPVEAAGAADRISAGLPPGVQIVTASARSQVTSEMTRAFQLNLVMLSSLALVVGMFLIYNTMTFSVIQRRALIGNLRALGVTRGQVFGLILSEAAVLGLLGALVGLVLGIGLASELIKLVTRTINDLYFSLNVRSVTLPSWVLAKGLALGLGAAVVAAAVPALEATRVPPRVASIRSLVESRMRSLAPRAALCGVLSIALGLLMLTVPGGHLGLGFLALFGLVLGFTLLAPGATVLIVRCARPLAGALSGSLGPLSVQGVTSNLSRTAIAIAALMVALAATVGVGVMVDSFRRSVSNWLDVTLQADFYLTVPSSGGAALDPRIVERIGGIAGVAEVSMGRSLMTASPNGPTEVVAIRMASQSYQGFRFLEGDRAQAWKAFDAAGAVLVTEPYAWRHRLHPGDRVRLLTDQGEHDFQIAGVVRDYGSEQGAVIMSRTTFERAWTDRGYSTLGVYVAAGADPGKVIEGLRGAVGGSLQDVLIRSTASIREASLEVFDRTFTITIVLRTLATAVAFVGVLSALMALQLERAREMAILRALGLTQGQVWGVVGVQTGLMGLIAGLLSIPLGLGMALLLIVVINRRSFGWSIDVYVDPGLLGQALMLAFVASLLAGLYPALKMTRTTPALALREE